MGTSMNALILAALLCQATDSACKKDWDSVVVITSYIPSTPSTYNHVEYLRACSAYGRGDTVGVRLHAHNVLDSMHRPVERRHEIVSEIILRDIGAWRDGDLGDIDRLMTRATDRLANGRIPSVIPLQEDIIRKLDRLIQEQEEAGKPKPQSQPSNEEPQKPADQPVSGGPDGKGIVDAKTIKKLQESWGTLPEKERQKVLSEIQRSIPDKYKPLVEQYLKSLSSSK